MTSSRKWPIHTHAVNLILHKYINSTANGENTCHHYLCTVLPQIQSAKSDFILAISVSKTHPLPTPTQILHDHCLEVLLSITVVPRDEDKGGGGRGELGGKQFALWSM